MKCASLIPPVPITGGFYPLSHDMRCPWRFECDRWLQRCTGTDHTPHQASMLGT